MAATSYNNSVIPATKSWPRCELLQIIDCGKIYRPVFTYVNEKSFTEKLAESRSSKVKRSAGMHSHRFHHIFLYTQGANEVTLESCRHSVKSGMLLCIPPGQQHSIVPHIPHGYSRLELNLQYIDEQDRPYTKPLHEVLSHIAGLNLSNVGFPVVLPAKAFAECERCLRGVLRTLQERSRNSDLQTRVLLSRFFQTMIEHVYLTGKSTVPAEPGGLARARAHIEENLTTALSVPDLAMMACISRAHFIRRFREVYGAPPIAYQRQLRIDKARQLLLYSDLTATEIAEQLGFRTVQYFNRVFARVVGIAPIRFRKEQQ